MSEANGLTAVQIFRPASRNLERVPPGTARPKTNGTGGLNIPGLGTIGGGVDVASSETGTEILETRKRINDQYLFSQLYSELDGEDMITSIPDDRPEGHSGQVSFESGDIVEITGMAKTDPLYRMLNVASLFARIDAVDLDEEKAEMARKVTCHWGNNKPI